MPEGYADSRRAHATSARERTTPGAQGGLGRRAVSSAGTRGVETCAQPLTGERDQLGCGLEIDLGAEQIHMPHVGGEPREPRAEVGATLVPAGQTVDGERGAEIVGPRPDAPVRRLETGTA